MLEPRTDHVVTRAHGIRVVSFGISALVTSTSLSSQGIPMTGKHVRRKSRVRYASEHQPYAGTQREVTEQLRCPHHILHATRTFDPSPHALDISNPHISGFFLKELQRSNRSVAADVRSERRPCAAPEDAWEIHCFARYIQKHYSS